MSTPFCCVTHCTTASGPCLSRMSLAVTCTKGPWTPPSSAGDEESSHSSKTAWLWHWAYAPTDRTRTCGGTGAALMEGGLGACRGTLGALPLYTDRSPLITCGCADDGEGVTRAQLLASQVTHTLDRRTHAHTPHLPTSLARYLMSRPGVSTASLVLLVGRRGPAVCFASA